MTAEVCTCVCMCVCVCVCVCACMCVCVFYMCSSALKGKKRGYIVVFFVIFLPFFLFMFGVHKKVWLCHMYVYFILFLNSQP